MHKITSVISSSLNFEKKKRKNGQTEFFIMVYYVSRPHHNWLKLYHNSMPISVLWCQSCDSMQKCSKTCNINQLWQAWNNKISCRNINKELKRAQYSCQKCKFTTQSSVDCRIAKLKKLNFKIQSRIQRRLLYGFSLYFLHCRSLFIKSLALPAGGGGGGGGG